MVSDRERGAAAIEFALVLPLLIGLVFAIIQFGWLLHAWTVMEGGARQGARDMSIHDDIDKAKDVALSDMPSLGLSAADVEVSVPGGSCDPGEFVTVTVTYTSPMPQWIPGAPSTIRRTGVAQCAG